jgi:hypothetical protein
MVTHECPPLPDASHISVMRSDLCRNDGHGYWQLSLSGCCVRLLACKLRETMLEDTHILSAEPGFVIALNQTL